MDRRTFLCETGGALLGAACGVPFSWISPMSAIAPVAAIARRDAVRANACIAVFDPALSRGRALARYAARAGIEAWPAATDIGLLWHAGLARRAVSRGTVIAVLRPSDRFVLTRLAASGGVGVLALDAQARSAG